VLYFWVVEQDLVSSNSTLCFDMSAGVFVLTMVSVKRSSLQISHIDDISRLVFLFRETTKYLFTNK